MATTHDELRELMSKTFESATTLHRQLRRNGFRAHTLQELISLHLWRERTAIQNATTVSPREQSRRVTFLEEQLVERGLSPDIARSVGSTVRARLLETCVVEGFAAIQQTLNVRRLCALRTVDQPPLQLL